MSLPMLAIPKVCSIDACDRPVLVTCECHSELFCNDHFMEHTAQSSPNADADRSPNSIPNKRSCFNSVKQWWGYLYQRAGFPADEAPEQKTEMHLEQRAAVVESQPEKKKKSVQKERSKRVRRNLFPLKQPFRLLHVPEKNSISMGCSGAHLLIEQKANLCLYDRTLTLVKQVPWTFTHVNVCWASTLDRFILVTHKTIFTLDETTMELQECPIAHHNMKDWSGAACSDTALFLSTMDMAASLYEYTLLPSIEFVQERRLSVMCPMYESILTFTYGNERLALVICNAHAFQNRLELHSAVTFESLWAVQLDVAARCCWLKNDEWIVVNYLEAELLRMSSDGQLLENFKDKAAAVLNPIINAVQWDEDILVTATLNSVRLHKL